MHVDEPLQAKDIEDHHENAPQQNSQHNSDSEGDPTRHTNANKILGSGIRDYSSEIVEPHFVVRDGLTTLQGGCHSLKVFR